MAGRKTSPEEMYIFFCSILNLLISEIDISQSMFHSPKRHHGICSPLHLYQRSASAPSVGTSGIITGTNRDLAERAARGSSWKIVRWVDLTHSRHQCLISLSLSLGLSASL